MGSTTFDPDAGDVLHPKDDNKYGNALSMVFYFRHGSHTILFPGDMTPEGMAHILANGRGVQKRFSRFEKGFAQKHQGWHEETGSQPTLKELLGRGLTVLVAPHHGLESCYSKELFAAMWGGKPSLTCCLSGGKPTTATARRMLGTSLRWVPVASQLM